MSRYRLVASDLDGTLLRSSYEVSERTVAAIAAVQAAGAMFVPATARSPRSTREIAEAFGMRDLAICGNGAIVYDLAQQRIVDHRPLHPDACAAFVPALREALPGAVFGAESELRFIHEHAYPFGIPVPPELRTAVDSLEHHTHPVTKIVVKHPSIAIETLYEVAVEIAGDRALVVLSGGTFIELLSPEVTKGSTLAAVCDRLGVAREHVLAFGDYHNDTDMLRWAGHGVATANADPAVLAVADEVCGSNDDDGVAAYLEGLLNAGAFASV